jgi:hypothetical protein
MRLPARDSSASRLRRVTGTIPAAPADGATSLPTDLVRQAAAKHGISLRMLRRLPRQGLLAAPHGAGQGRGPGRSYSYPPRVLEQLAAIGAARREGHRASFIRHWIWWAPDGRLENWDRWRRDRIAELRTESVEWDLPAALDDEFPAERERHMIDAAARLKNSRQPLLLRGKLRGQADREAYVRFLSSAMLKDDMLLPLAGAGSPEDSFRRLEEILAEPVAGRTYDDAPPGESWGQLVDRGTGWSHPPVAGVAPGAAAASSLMFVPAPADAATRLAAMTEQRAAELRSAFIGWAERAGSGEACRRVPALAGMLLVMLDTVAWFFPQALELPAEMGAPVPPTPSYS